MPLSIQEKKKLLTKLKKLLTTTSKISNTLIVEENTHSKNQDLLYRIRQETVVCRSRLDFVEYK